MGHTCRHCAAVFNNLPAVAAGDLVVVTTNKGVFTYVVETTEDVPFADFAGRADIWAVVPNRVILFTCHSTADEKQYIGVRVVTGELVSATPA